MKSNYFIIPVLVFLVAYMGVIFTSTGIDSGWYEMITKPSFTPTGSFIGLVWTVIFILMILSALIFFNSKFSKRKFWIVSIIFFLNGLVNIFWSWLFFKNGFLGLAFFDALIIEATVLMLIVLIWRVSKVASILLIPYSLWVIFASYLNFVIWQLN